MILTPLDIHNKEFRKAFRGYDEEEVDEFLDRVAKDYETLFKENAGLKEALQAKDSDIGTYRELEQTLQKTLVIAQQTADEMKHGAHREADAVIQEARLKAEQIVAAAEEKVKNILREYEDIRKESQAFRVRFRSFLRSQLELIGEQEDVSFDEIVSNEAAVSEAATAGPDRKADF